MTALSFNKGNPIAYVSGGKYDGKIIHIYDKPKNNPIEEDDIENDPLDMIDDNFIRSKKKYMTAREAQMIKESIINKKLIDSRYADIYNESQNYIDSRKDKEFNIYDGELLPMPTNQIDHTTGKEKAHAYFIAAPRDSGKSTFAGKFVNIYKQFFKKNRFYIFSRVEKDVAYDYLKPIRIILDEDIIENPINISDLSNSVVIFDDIDTRTKDPLNEAIRKLRDEIFENGRHHSITVLACAHTLLNYRETKPLLLEASHVVIFPQGGYMQQIKRFLKEYIGIDDKKDIKKIFNLGSRWVLIKKTYPMYIMHEKGIYLL